MAEQAECGQHQQTFVFAVIEASADDSGNGRLGQRRDGEERRPHPGEEPAAVGLIGRGTQQRLPDGVEGQLAGGEEGQDQSHQHRQRQPR